MSYYSYYSNIVIKHNLFPFFSTYELSILLKNKKINIFIEIYDIIKINKLNKLKGK